MYKESGVSPASGAYRGRFAPSPTGDLHLGSLLAAVASYLEARVRGGQWLVRIEDLDPPRMVQGAEGRILAQLEAYGFEWDGAVLRQSERLDRYEAALQHLIASGQVYPCACTRKEVAAIARAGIDGPVYPGTCRGGIAAGRDPRAWRLRVADVVQGFEDGVQGWCEQRLASEVGDFVVKRADGLFAYQLAVVVDDAEQGVTDIVRGADLLDSAPRQRYLQHCLGYRETAYVHVPVLVNARGEKLSKQTLAPSLRAKEAVSSLYLALRLLGQRPPDDLLRADVKECWRWACAHWCLARVPRQRNVHCDEVFGLDTRRDFAPDRD
ncbi:tRNA glutamyl-Q(34) synthetase GluQRS [Chitinolyticbacter albus]|uniref:tRNA glutamyl-Q(34) synthetase GluQRS n=1 Tax=Chitinolyticbacter albus TaxID=2961951 RepID=UPI00357112BC